MINTSASLKSIVCGKKGIVEILPSTCICEDSKHLEHIANDSVIVCDAVIYVMDKVSRIMSNAIPRNMKNTI